MKYQLPIVTSVKKINFELAIFKLKSKLIIKASIYFSNFFLTIILNIASKKVILNINLIK